MDEALISNWNKVVTPDDDVYNLGDVAFGGSMKRILWLLSRLNRRNMFLVKGNHDHRNLKDPKFAACFTWVKDYHELYYNKRLYIMSHYPFLSWNHMSHNSICLQGHTHNNIDNSKTLRLDVGVDNPLCSYAPISMGRIDMLMENKRKSLRKADERDIL
jgi:calcineurin-like phosphoesterase family protein